MRPSEPLLARFKEASIMLVFYMFLCRLQTFILFTQVTKKKAETEIQWTRCPVQTQIFAPAKQKKFQTVRYVNFYHPL